MKLAALLNQEEAKAWITFFGAMVIFSLLVFDPNNFLGSLLPFVRNFGPPYNPDGVRSLLSTMSQGLLAILAIILTISLVVGQLATQYSQRAFQRVFTIPTLLYMLLVLISVLFSMILLPTVFNEEVPFQYVKLSLFLAGSCLLLLIPYFWSFRRKLSPEAFLRDLGKEALRDLERFFNKKESQRFLDNNPFEPDQLKTIDNVSRKAIDLRDNDVFESGLNEMLCLAVSIDRSNSGYHHARVGAEKRTLARIRSIVLENVASPNFLLTCTRVLNEWGNRASTKGLEGTSEGIAGVLAEIGLDAARKGWDDITGDVAEGLCHIGWAAKLCRVEKMRSVVGKIVSHLNKIGIEAAEKELKSSTFMIPSYLCSLCLFSIVKDGSHKGSMLLMGKDIIEGIKEIAAIAALNKNMNWPAIHAVEELWNVGVTGMQSSCKEMVDKVIEQLKELENVSRRELIDKGWDEAWYEEKGNVDERRCLTELQEVYRTSTAH